MLKVSFSGFDISKLDFFKGDHFLQDEPQERPETDEDYDDDDEDDFDDGKTLEGGLIQALINLQLKSYMTQFLPKFEQRFSNDITKVGAFECYGVHPLIPSLSYFKGGFIVSGSYRKVPVVNEACV